MMMNKVMNDDIFAGLGVGNEHPDFAKPKRTTRKAKASLAAKELEPWCEETDAEQPMAGRLHTAADATRFICAGRATITLRSKKTGTRFTYKISRPDDSDVLFVGVLNGPDNETAYAYLGRIAGGYNGQTFWAGRKVPKPTDVSRDAPSAKAFAWAWAHLAKGEMPEQLEIWHEGMCGRCGRKLTVPESIESGFGPECIGKLV